MKKSERVKSRILLVEDEESLALGLEYNLKEEGYEVIRTDNGRGALERIFDETFDLVILDIMLPYLNGFEVAEKIRKKHPTLPILMLTALTGAADRIRGLQTGADDYLTKPFHLEELLLRVAGMLKRKMWYRELLTKEPEYSFGSNFINFNELRCTSGRKAFRITPLEASLLKYLIDNRDRIISREEFLDNVWNINSDTETRTVDNFIMRFRKYFEKDPCHPVFFRNVRGAGYIFSPKGK
ncbi:MAG: response regulator transcription factor [Spirochaetales bacterium]|nr:response regulator transcription factor [Spirochaetales bacterium]